MGGHDDRAMIHFSQRLQEVIDSMNGKQKALAEKAGVSATNVSRWLKANSLPDREVLGRLVATLPERDGALLAAAWAQDQLPEIARNLVVTMPRDPSAKVKEEPDDWPKELNQASRRKFVNFARIARDYPDVMKIVDVLHDAAMRLPPRK